MLRLYKHCSLLPALLAAFVLGGCASTVEGDKPAAEYFSRAMEYMEDEDYLLATEQFEQLNAVHPFSQYSEQSLLELAYAYYFNGDRERCRVTLGRLMRQYPDSQQLDYALYLRGIANFDEDRNLLHNGFGASPAQRSLKGARLAFDDFSRLVRDFPHSRFAPDARRYMVYIRDQLALKEILIGEFYLERNASVAALGRAQQVLEAYISTRYTARALDLIARAYQQMDMAPQAEQTRARLMRLYPHYQTTDGIN